MRYKRKQKTIAQLRAERDRLLNKDSKKMAQTSNERDLLKKEIRDMKIAKAKGGLKKFGKATAKYYNKLETGLIEGQKEVQRGVNRTGGIF